MTDGESDADEGSKIRVFSPTDKTLDDIIKSYGAKEVEVEVMGEKFYQTHDGYGSACDKQMLLDLMALAKQAGREEGIDSVHTSVNDAFKRGKQIGRDEENKNWVETKAFLDNGKDEKIAALEAKVEIMKTKECPTCKRTRGTTAERLKCYCCLDEENARLRELLKEVYPFIGYAFDKAGRTLPASAASGQLKQKIMKALEDCSCDGQIDCDDCVKKEGK